MRFVELIRERGEPRLFRGRTYIELDVDDHFYWTMGAPVSETTLVNRKVLERPSDETGAEAPT